MSERIYWIAIDYDSNVDYEEGITSFINQLYLQIESSFLNLVVNMAWLHTVPWDDTCHSGFLKAWQWNASLLSLSQGHWQNGTHSETEMCMYC